MIYPEYTATAKALKPEHVWGVLRRAGSPVWPE